MQTFMAKTTFSLKIFILLTLSVYFITCETLIQGLLFDKPYYRHWEVSNK